MLEYLIIAIIYGIIFGFATKKVIENKGYSENWFWWGFFFGIIALIVACTKPDNVNTGTYSQYSLGNRTTDTSKTWLCKCNQVNSIYVGTCSCGRTRDSVLNGTPKIASSGAPNTASSDTWVCICNRRNPAYVGTCACGRTKEFILNKTQKLSSQKTASKSTDDELAKLNLLKEYKALLDSGAITQEEFDAKKKDILK